jgi:hypothetical protein
MHTVLPPAGLALALGLGLTGLVAGCAGPAAPGPTEPAATAAPVERSADTTRPPAAAAGSPTPTALPAPTAGAPIPLVLEPTGFEPGLDVRPGPWAADGRALVAYRIVREATGAHPVGHVWTVDAVSGRPLADSGDVEGPLPERMADWRADGSLVLARRDGMLLTPDGERAGEVVGLEGQPRQVAVAPDGQTIFAVGPDGTWLIGADGSARAVSGLEAPPAAWEWHPDAGRLVVALPDGSTHVVDLATAAARKIAAVPSGTTAAAVSAPRWLADGRILIRQPLPGAADPAATEYRLVDPETTQAEALSGFLEPGGAAGPADSTAWVSPDARLIALTRFGPDHGVLDSWLIDVVDRSARPLPPAPWLAWAPRAEALLFPENGALMAYRPSDGQRRALVAAGGWSGQPDRLSGSPDGRWLLYGGPDGSLWLVAGDGHAGPTRVAGGALWPPGPSWSPAGDRFAAALALGAEPPRLMRVSIGPGP